ncbi:trypsin, alkaline C-like [Anticarsia gemmatalis]|uniref:trypsin, alkaline C-like n=1 Tax=Anticarsia gemmatalis TaxID=129554 RepID=UPI003F76A041
MRAINFLVVCVAAVTAASDTARVAGAVTTIDRYPSIVSIISSGDLFHDWHQTCVGSILNNRAILTAAQCILNNPLVTQRVRVGSSFALNGGTLHTISQVIIHPNWGSFMIDSDIAVLHLRNFIQYNDFVQPGRFAGPNYNVAVNEPVWAAGWGVYHHIDSDSEQLRHTQLSVADQEVCRNRYGVLVTDGMICTRPREESAGLCGGDAGSPIFHHGVVVGVLSYNGPVTCGSDLYPSVNIGVPRYITWISANA